MSEKIAQGGTLSVTRVAQKLSAAISAGNIIVNDYLIQLTEIPGGFRLTVTRGSEVQSMDVIGGDVDEEYIAQLVEEYLAENPPSGGTVFKPDGHTLLLEEGILRVNTASAAEEDNTLPITSAAVAEQVGNIEVLLKTI